MIDLVKAFHGLVHCSQAGPDRERLLSFSCPRYLLQNAALSVEAGPVVLHNAAGLIGDECFDYPGIDWEGSPDAMVDVRFRFTLQILARLTNAGANSDVIRIRSSLSPFPLATVAVASIPNNFVTSEYLDSVTSKIGRNHWWTEACFAREGQLHVLGWAIPPQGWRAGLPQVKIDGNDAEVLPATAPWADSTYWFLAGQDVLGFYAHGPSSPNDGFSEIQLSFEPADRNAGIRRFSVYQLASSMGDIKLPIPPNENIHRVAGPGANQYTYINGGKSDFERFKILIFEALGITSLKDLRVLDWGVGCGRLARYFVEQGAQVTGADIDAGNIAWCNANLTPGRYVTVGLMPPTDLARDQFDVIISSSVLSHLTETAMQAWLGEINQLLAPGGVGLLSFNGDGNAYLYGASHPPAIDALNGNGFYDEWRTADLDGAVAGAEDYYRFTIMSTSRATAFFKEAAHLERIVPGVTSMHQDIAVLRKKLP